MVRGRRHRSATTHGGASRVSARKNAAHGTVARPTESAARKSFVENASKAFLRHAWENLWARNRARILADAPKTLWLFGAGASHHYNLNSRGIPVPLADGFFPAFNALPTSTGFNAHVGPLISYRAEYRDVPPDRVSEWTENIEAFMTSIERDLEAIKRRKGKRTRRNVYKGISLATALNNMTFILGNVINEAQNGPTESLYRYLLDFRGPNDIFVTFNWDTLLDRALAATGGWSPNDGYCLSFASVLDGTWKARVSGTPQYRTNWKLLKLHGSTNWLIPYAGYQPMSLEFQRTVPKSDLIFLYWQSTMPFATHQERWIGGYAPTCYGYYPPHIRGKMFPAQHLSPGPGRAFVKVTQTGVVSPFAEPNVSGVPSSPVLITPIRQKRYTDYEASIQTLWNKADRLARQVDRIVVVGYSFPKTDVRAANLLVATLLKRKQAIELEIVAPDADRIASRLGSQNLKSAKSVSLYPMRFEEYIHVLRLERAPLLMTQAAKTDNQVREWLGRLFAVQHVPVGLIAKRYLKRG